MSRAKLGDRIPPSYIPESKLLIIFVSRFCSKCHYSKRVLDEVLKGENINIPILEVDIAYPHPLIDLLRPQSIPTIVLVDKDGRIRALTPSQICPRIARALAKLIRNIC